MNENTPQITEIKLHQKSRLLEVAYADGRTFQFPCEFLRVYSPSAEVAGHGPGQEVLQVGKRDVGITDISPVGNYGVNIAFTDGHDTGIYTWERLYDYGRRMDELWQQYLERMAKAGASREPGAAAPFDARPKSK